MAIAVQLFWFYILFFSVTSYASCAGLKGCNPCYDSLKGAAKEDIKCETDAQCVAVPHRCGDFYALNKAYSEKYIDKSLTADASKKAPILECKLDSGWNTKICRPKK